jgi:hypothetical protein
MEYDKLSAIEALVLRDTRARLAREMPSINHNVILNIWPLLE